MDNESTTTIAPNNSGVSVKSVTWYSIGGYLNLFSYYEGAVSNNSDVRRKTLLLITYLINNNNKKKIARTNSINISCH